MPAASVGDVDLDRARFHALAAMADPSTIDETRSRSIPAVVRVQARLRRLMLIAGLTLGLGILAVFLAILYRLFTYESGGAPVPVVEGAAIPTVNAHRPRAAGRRTAGVDLARWRPDRAQLRRRQPAR